MGIVIVINKFLLLARELPKQYSSSRTFCELNGGAVGYHLAVFDLATMKTKKSARKYAASGRLKKEIQTRHKHQQIKKRFEGRKGRKANGKGSQATLNGKEKTSKGHRNVNREDEDDEDDDVEMEIEETKGKASKQSKQKKNDKEESENGFLSGTGVSKTSIF